MRSGSWFNRLVAGGGIRDLPERLRDELSTLDSFLFAIWNLGDNVLLAWTHSRDGLLFLSVRHYVIPELVHGARPGDADLTPFINAVLAGPKYYEPGEFERVCQAFNHMPESVRAELSVDNARVVELVSDMVRCYGVSLVRNRAVILMDAVKFSLRSPLDQMAMLNSLAYSVNSAYEQLLSRNIRIDFARTTTGDGFYIWNRATVPGANNELYKLMMMILADNAVAQSKARSEWVPRLRVAFHVGEHYEFHQVEGLNPTNVSYIVGQVTVDLSRMVERALPGQILIGDFDTQDAAAHGKPAGRYDTLDFVSNAAATLDPLNGLEISGARIEKIHCYLTGRSMGGGRYQVDRFHLSDKHSTMRAVYNAKINIHRGKAEPIFLGIRSDGLQDFNATRVEALDRLVQAGD